MTIPSVTVVNRRLVMRPVSQDINPTISYSSPARFEFFRRLFKKFAGCSQPEHQSLGAGSKVRGNDAHCGSRFPDACREMQHCAAISHGIGTALCRNRGPLSDEGIDLSPGTTKALTARQPQPTGRRWLTTPKNPSRARRTGCSSSSRCRS